MPEAKIVGPGRLGQLPERAHLGIHPALRPATGTRFADTLQPAGSVAGAVTALGDVFAGNHLAPDLAHEARIP